MLSGIGHILGMVTLMVLVRLTGKRRIVLFSYIGTAATCTALGFYSFHRTRQTVSLVPLIIYTAHVYFAGLGVLTVPWMYISEIFPYRYDTLIYYLGGGGNRYDRITWTFRVYFFKTCAIYHTLFLFKLSCMISQLLYIHDWPCDRKDCS